MSSAPYRLFFCIFGALVTVSVPAAAQSEADVKRFFEGKRVVVRLDMPATKDGVDIYPLKQPNALDFREYSARLRQHGTAIKAGDSVVVTLVKAKDKLIEFQLGGGGYGTAGDDTSTSVSVPDTEKTKREKNLEDAVKKEPDPKQKRRMEEELSDLRAYRLRENTRLRAVTAQASEAKREGIRQKALQAGSRFNIRFQAGYLKEVPVTPELVMRLLAEYIDFSTGSASVTPIAERSGPTPLKKGMSRSEVLALIGQPLKTSERAEGSLKVLTCRFQDKDNEIEAEFIDDILIRYRVSSK